MGMSVESVIAHTNQLRTLHSIAGSAAILTLRSGAMK